MASAAQIIANHENATHSTGPVTEIGKKRSRFNAFRHGLTGQNVLMPHEDSEIYHAFIAAYHTELKPRGILEEQLTQTLADIQWRLNRARAHESAILSMGRFDADAADDQKSPIHPHTQDTLDEAQACLDHTTALRSLSLHEHRWQKLYFVALRELTALQAARHAREESEMAAAVVLFKHHKVENLPFDPKDFGFVLTALDIEHYLWRVNSIHAAETTVRTNPKAARIRVGSETRQG